MKTSRLMVGLALAGSIGYATYAYAAGMFQGLQIVGGATYCSGASASATGTIIGTVTGCPNTVAAGPTSVTGNEKVPADTFLSSGINPQTVYMPMAAFNALPITVVSASSTPAGVSATNISGGTYYRAYGPITSAAITLPASPMDGQQYRVGSNVSITTLTVSAAVGVSVTNQPTTLTTSNIAPYGYLFWYESAQSQWHRLQ